jgi:hypothetical protein
MADGGNQLTGQGPLAAVNPAYGQLANARPGMA